MKNILITGGSGMVGTRLTEMLLKDGHAVSHLTRSRNSKSGVKTWLWNPRKDYLEDGALDGVDTIIHLAGAGIADKKWSPERKNILIQSRVAGPAMLLRKVEEQGVALESFLSASGINYYGSGSTEKIYTEEDPAGDDFTAECCVAWEKAATDFEALCRVAILRISVVLSNKGGALPRLSKPIGFGFGAALGKGDQYIPWVHLEDVCAQFVHLVNHQKLTGVYNTVAPEHTTNKKLTKAVAKQMRMPLFLPSVPAGIIRFAFGEMATLVLEGARADGSKIAETGYTFQFPELEGALKNIYPKMFK